jgi:hypothetical protein
MPKLNVVFGVSNTIPQYTYVDRSGLDTTFSYSMQCDRHIVLHGGSKQGKTVLRRKNIPDGRSVVVQCNATTSRVAIYSQILAALQVSVPTSSSTKYSTTGEAGGKAGLSIPFVSSEVAGKVTTASETMQSQQAVGIDAENIHYIASAIKESGRRVVIEDFHYMPEDEKRVPAFDLKAFWDLGIFFIVVGIWAEHNLLTFYNSDLSGRIDEIDVQWKDDELGTVLSKGEEALRMIIVPHIRQRMIDDASQNVGLLQRIAEQFCFFSGVLETSSATVAQTLADEKAFQSARAKICGEETVRYRQFGEALSHGFKASEESELRVYMNIARCAIEASDQELRQGMHYNTVFERVSSMNPRIRRSDLTAALQRLNRLQQDRRISPLVLSYNDATKELQLVDRELLFYRKYGSPTWPWEEQGGNSAQLLPEAE